MSAALHRNSSLRIYRLRMWVSLTSFADQSNKTSLWMKMESEWSITLRWQDQVGDFNSIDCHLLQQISMPESSVPCEASIFAIPEHRRAETLENAPETTRQGICEKRYHAKGRRKNGPWQKEIEELVLWESVIRHNSQNLKLGAIRIGSRKERIYAT